MSLRNSPEHANEPSKRMMPAGEPISRNVRYLMALVAAGFAATAILTAGTSYNHYVGNLHSHTSYSDGEGFPADAFGYARDSAGIDFLAVTDHHNMLSEAHYADILAQADNFTENGVFIGLGGQEWSGTGPSHSTVYQADHVFRAPADDCDSFYVELLESGCTATFCHPAPGNFNDFAYSATGDAGINAVEVRYENEEVMYIKILNKGWRVGVDGSQDNHCWDWGDLPRYTVVLAPALTRADILDAHRNHRTYTIRDRDIRVTYHAEGHGMGETFTHEGNLSFSITVSDSGIDDRFEFIRLYQNGLPIAWIDVDSCWAGWSPSITPPNGMNHYFVKAQQRDHNRAWTSPIWIDCTCVLPSTPALASPEAEAVLCDLRPTLAWRPSDLAGSYTLQYSAADSFPAGPQTVTVPGIADTCYTPTHLLGDRRCYYWRVTAVNDSGTSICSGTSRFFTEVEMFAGGSDMRITSDPAGDERPSILQASTLMWLAWSSERFGDTDVYYKTTPDGESWSEDVRLTSAPGEDLSPAIMECADGEVWVAWHSARTGDSEIYCRTYDGVSWSADALLTGHPGSDEEASLAQGPDSLVWMVWASDRRDGNFEIYCKTFDGDAWSDGARLTYDDSLDYHPRIARAANGDLWLLWSTNRNGSPEIYGKIHDGISWSEDIRLGWTGESPSVTGSSEGTVWAAYVRDMDVYYRIHENGEWSDESGLPTVHNGSSWSALTQDSDGRVWVAFSSAREANQDIYAQQTVCPLSSGVEPEHSPGPVPEPVLLRNHPNPFRLSTDIELRLPQPGHVELTVYGVQGKRVATLLSGWKSAGNHSVGWDGRDCRGREVPCGVYFCMLRSAGSVQSRKIVLVR